MLLGHAFQVEVRVIRVVSIKWRSPPLYLLACLVLNFHPYRARGPVNREFE